MWWLIPRRQKAPLGWWFGSRTLLCNHRSRFESWYLCSLLSQWICWSVLQMTASLFADSWSLCTLHSYAARALCTLDRYGNLGSNFSAALGHAPCHQFVESFWILSWRNSVSVNRQCLKSSDLASRLTSGVVAQSIVQCLARDFLPKVEHYC